MSLTYTVVKIFAGEESSYNGKPLPMAIVDFVSGLKISARCLVTKAVAGCYENGDIATYGVEAMSFNMPLEITVILPERESAKVIPMLEEMSDEGIMLVEQKEILWHKCRKQLIPRRIKVRDVMTLKPQTVPLSATAADALRILLRASFHGVPVVDAQGKPAGMITHGDLMLRAGMRIKVGLLSDFAAQQLRELDDSLAKIPLCAVMSNSLVTIGEDEPLSKAVDIMLEHKVKRLPVVSGDGKICGILSRLDIFKTILDKAPDWRSFHNGGVALGDVKTVKDAMRKDTPSVSPDAPVWDALKLIETTDIKRVAVVGSDGKLLGAHFRQRAYVRVFRA